MAEFPDSLEAAIDQACHATQAAMAAGYTRLSVEMLIPELNPMVPANQYLSVFEELGPHLKVFFTDAGTAALARREWAGLPYRICSIDVAGSRQTSGVDELVASEDQAFVFVAPTSVEVYLTEKICQVAGDRPVVLFYPQLEDVGTVGIGYAARELRRRFLSQFEPCYYLRPLDPAHLLRCYPAPWQVWLEQDGTQTAIWETPLKPDAETLDRILREAMGQPEARNLGLFSTLQAFLKALGQ
ncbi:MAG: DUF1995 family protein [Leptolyngbyaceae cyanobacterium]